MLDFLFGRFSAQSLHNFEYRIAMPHYQYLFRPDAFQPVNYCLRRLRRVGSYGQIEPLRQWSGRLAGAEIGRGKDAVDTTVTQAFGQSLCPFMAHGRDTGGVSIVGPLGMANDINGGGRATGQAQAKAQPNQPAC